MTPEEKFDNLTKIINLIKQSEITILTGDNSTGKSLIRKALPSRIIREIYGDDKKEIPGVVRSISMELRTTVNPNFMALSSAMLDCSTEATSLNTFHLIESLMETFNDKDKDDNCKYIVIDEPEIGCSKETQLGIVYYLNDKLLKLKEKGIGVLVITHSELIVEQLFHDNFLSLSNYNTKEEWLNRPIVGKDLNELKKESINFFRYINNLLQKKK